MRLKISNPVLSGEERTFLTSDYASGTSLTVRNNNGATANKYVVVGEPGQERTETSVISGVTGTGTIDLTSALNFSHPKSTSVYIFIYNQLSFERKPASGSFTAISGSPFNIDWDNDDNTTLISVTGGASTDTYRWRFYNSATGVYSDYSDELPGTGIARNKLGYVIQQVRRNPIAIGVTNDILIDYASDFQSIVYEQMPKAWWFQKEGTEVATAVDTYRYSVSDNWNDFLSMKFMMFHYVSGSIENTYPLTYSPLNEFYNLKADSAQSSDDNAVRWTLLPSDDDSEKGYIGIHPTPKTAVCFLKPVYQFELTDLNSYGDRLVVPDPKGYVDYILYRIYDDIKQDATNAQKQDAKVARAINGLKRRSKRQLGQPELWRFRGIRGWSRMYGGGGIQYSQTNKENYF